MQREVAAASPGSSRPASPWASAPATSWHGPRALEAERREALPRQIARGVGWHPPPVGGTRLPRLHEARLSAIAGQFARGGRSC